MQESSFDKNRRRGLANGVVDQTTLGDSSGVALERRPLTTFTMAAWLLGGLTVARLVGLYFSNVDLFYDESQYWDWSRELAFGYFSKPPLLAWIISLSNTVCGTSEDCLRSSSPLFYFGLALLTYAIARDLYGRRTAFWAALVIALTPGASFSSRIISTDVPLLFFWALALLAYIKLLQSGKWSWALLLGIALGLGMLAKYAMVYFVLSIAAAGVVDTRARQLFRTPQLWFALALWLLALVPNLVWNVQNGFVTLQHTGDNITGSGFSFSSKGAFEFIGSQFGVVGPLVFGAFLAILAAARGQQISRADRLMIVFAVPPLLCVTLLGFLRPVHANWAVPAFVSLVVLTTAVLLRKKFFSLVVATLTIGAVVQVALLIGDVIPYKLGIAALGPQADFYHRTLGWRNFSEATGALAQRLGAKTILSEGRAEPASLIYYLRATPHLVQTWPGQAGPDNQFDLTDAVGQSVDTPALFVSVCPLEDRLLRYFRDVRSLAPLDISTGPNSGRRYYAFLLDAQTKAIAPIAPCGQ